jgi:hypothetical protein
MHSDPSAEAGRSTAARTRAPELFGLDRDREGTRGSPALGRDDNMP